MTAVLGGPSADWELKIAPAPMRLQQAKLWPRDFRQHCRMRSRWPSGSWERSIRVDTNRTNRRLPPRHCEEPQATWQSIETRGELLMDCLVTSLLPMTARSPVGWVPKGPTNGLTWMVEPFGTYPTFAMKFL